MTAAAAAAASHARDTLEGVSAGLGVYLALVAQANADVDAALSELEPDDPVYEALVSAGAALQGLSDELPGGLAGAVAANDELLEQIDEPPPEPVPPSTPDASASLRAIKARLLSVRETADILAGVVESQPFGQAPLEWPALALPRTPQRGEFVELPAIAGFNAGIFYVTDVVRGPTARVSVVRRVGG